MPGIILLLHRVWSNYHTYNTTLAACIDCMVERTYIGANIVTDMLDDAETEIACGLKGSHDCYKQALSMGP